jgi:hypothetical protein
MFLRHSLVPKCEHGGVKKNILLEVGGGGVGMPSLPGSIGDSVFVICGGEKATEF